MDGRLVILKHVEKEGPGLIEEAFGSYGWPLDVIELDKGEKLPETLDQTAGVIVLGGPMNVYEEEAYPFLKEEGLFIGRVLSQEIPFLGICLGAQLLAKACGAGVVKAPVKEVGWYNVNATEVGRKDRLFRGTNRNLAVFQWHEDAFELPPDAVLLVESDPCRNQAFRIGTSAYGLQFHVEVTEEMIDLWLEDEVAAEKDRIATEGALARDLFVTQSALILRNFRRIVESTYRMKKVMEVFVEKVGKPNKELWWNLETHSLMATG